MSVLRDLPIHTAGVLLAALLATGPVAAEILELPAEWPLGIDSRLVFELDDADLHLTTRAGGLPVLRARTAAVGESANLEVTSSGGHLTVRRPGEEGASRVRIDVALGPGRAVHVAGTGLTVRAEDKLAGGLGVRLALDRSTARLSGVRVSRLEATSSSVTLVNTAGDLALTLTGGKARVQGHVGRLELRAGDAGVAVIDHRGQIVPEVEGGSLEIAGGDGTFAGTAFEANLSFSDWRGPAEVRARDSLVEILGGEHRDHWQIDGRESQLVLERIEGTVEATLEGGSFNAGDLSANLLVTAGGTRLDLIEVGGGVTLELSDAAEALIAGATGGVEAQVTDSRLEIDRVDRLKLTGSAADVIARGVERLESLGLRDSQLALDLRDSRPGASLELRGTGYASVQLTEPCIVQLSGGDGAFGHQVEVVGCELRTSGEQVSPRHDRLKYGVTPNRLTVSVGPDAVLEVEGEP